MGVHIVNLDHGIDLFTKTTLLGLGQDCGEDEVKEKDRHWAHSLDQAGSGLLRPVLFLACWARRRPGEALMPSVHLQ